MAHANHGGTAFVGAYGLRRHSGGSAHPGGYPRTHPQQTPEAPTSASVLLTDVGNQMSLMTPADWPRYRAEEGNQVYYIYQGDTTQSTLFSISSYEASGLSRDEATIRSLAADPWAAYAQGYRENGVAMEGLTEWKAHPGGRGLPWPNPGVWLSHWRTGGSRLVHDVEHRRTGVYCHGVRSAPIRGSYRSNGGKGPDQLPVYGGLAVLPWAPAAGGKSDKKTARHDSQALS